MGINHAEQEELSEAPIPESYKEKERRVLDELRAAYPGEWLFYAVSEGNEPYQLIAHGSREEVQDAQNQWSLNRSAIEPVGERRFPSIAMPLRRQLINQVLLADGISSKIKTAKTAEDIASLRRVFSTAGLESEEIDYVMSLIERSINNQERRQFATRLVNDQYGNRLGKLKRYGLYDPEQPQKNDVPPPTPNQVNDILRKQLTPDQFEVINAMEKPILQLIPVTSMARYINAMDNNHESVRDQWSERAIQRADERDNVKDNDTIVGWRIAITEGAKEPALLKDDNPEATLRVRNNQFGETYGQKGATGVDFKRMLLLMLDSLEDNEPINNARQENGNGTWTFINEELEDRSKIAGICWDEKKGRINLFGIVIDDDYNPARFRTSVVIDVHFLA